MLDHAHVNAISFAPEVLPDLDEGMVLSVILGRDNSIKHISLPECSAFDSARTELIGCSFGDLIVDDLDIVSSEIEAVRSFRKAVSFETKISGKSGALHDVRWYSYFSDEDENVVCVGQVVTKQNEANATARKIFSLLSRQLREPLQSIQQSATSISSSSMPAFAAEELEAVCRSTDKLLGLVDRLVSVFDRNEPHDRLSISEVSVSNLLVNSIDALKRYAAEKGVNIQYRKQYQFNVNDHDHESLNVLADEASLMQVLLNLLSNAIKFSPAGSTCTILTQRVGNSLEVCITDEGPGLTAEEAESAFRPFERLGRKDKEGFGLGLSICKNLIERQGGQIGVASTKGRGSSFWFQLPVASPISVSSSENQSVSDVTFALVG